MEIVEVEDRATIEETANLAKDIWHECYASLLSFQQIDYMVQTFQSNTAIEKQIKEEAYQYYLLRLEEKAVAYLGVQAQDSQLYLSKIYIDKNYRGKGLAQKLIEKAMQVAQSLACTSVWLTVNKENHRAMAAYEKAGFQRIRAQCTEIGQGFVMDDYVYAMQLDACL